jgi:hypothetical protein
MKQINKISFFLILYSILIFGLNIYAAENADADVAEQLLIKEQIERQEQELNANLLVTKANQSFLDKKYETARDQCLKAIFILSEIAPLDDATESKIAKVKDVLGMIYSYWAEDILKEADNSADLGKLEGAVKLCRQAAEMNPKLRAHSDKQIEKFEKKLERISTGILHQNLPSTLIIRKLSIILMSSMNRQKNYILIIIIQKRKTSSKNFLF